MAFTVYGIHNGKPVQVTWRDGRLDGDPTLVKLVRCGNSNVLCELQVRTSDASML